ncbi:MAG: hypothetical protein JST92_02770 [Deltaproteobacteria bacterium]|nr:hypothetical protein [Deltaproteobacteria bacterium]
MKIRSALSLVIAASAIAIPLACSDGGDTVPADPTILLDREDVEIAAYVKTKQNVSLQILNKGRGALTVSDVHLELPDGGALPGNSVFSQPIVAVDAGSLSDPLPIVIGGLGTGFVQFSYSPQTPGKSSARMVVKSNAPARAEIDVPVNGCATNTDGGGATCACAADAGC